MPGVAASGRFLRVVSQSRAFPAFTGGHVRDMRRRRLLTNRLRDRAFRRMQTPVLRRSATRQAERMPHPQPLPSDLPPFFAVADAVARGISRGRLNRHDLRRPFYGVRADGRQPENADVSGRCLEYAPRLRPWQFFSHETALALMGAPMPEWPYRPAIHVSAHRPAREPRVEGVRGHRLQVREPATWRDANLLPLEHPARAWRQAATLWSLEDLIAAGDFLVSGARPLASVADLQAEIALMGDTRACVLRRALALVRPGVRSPRESRLRLLIARAGLPEPQINWVLRDSRGRHVAELDLAYPYWRVGVEYDGRVHSEDSAQFAKDADRWDLIRAQGWEHVRILNHHLRGSGDIAVRKIAEALGRSGWRATG